MSGDTPSKNTGKPFEEAVARFVQALDPTAEIKRNHFGRDKDTGERQQMDVLVKAKLMGHYPLTILISCKDHQRPLTVEHIRAFRGELEDSSATMGIIYSGSGFNDHALAKAKANGIVCCRLFQDQPAELPEAVTLSCYLCKGTAFRPTVHFTPGRGLEALTWEWLLAQAVTDDDGKPSTILEVIENTHVTSEVKSAQQPRQGKVFPLGWETWLKTQLRFPPKVEVHLILRGGWKLYRGKREAHLVNGSYCLDDKSFHGNLYSPSIDTWSEHPGPGWEEVNEDLDQPKGNVVRMFFVGPPVRAAIVKVMTGPLVNEPLPPEPS